MRITVLMTCHNRREITLGCLDALFANDLHEDIAMEVVLVDDGSSDGTADAVKQRFPSVVLEKGDGSLFWNRGMHRAQEIAMHSSPDFVLWLNDDTQLLRDAVVRLVESYRSLTLHVGHPVIVVGATVDRATRELTYAGMEPISRVRRFSYRKVWHPEESRECQAMNGNFVLIPHAIVEKLGNLDPIFEHAMGDVDYALRARDAGFGVFVSGGVMGYCSSNPLSGGHADRGLPFRVRWLKFVGRKGLPPSSWRHFVRKHSGILWPLYFLYPYIKFATIALILELRGATKG